MTLEQTARNITLPHLTLEEFRAEVGALVREVLPNLSPFGANGDIGSSVIGALARSRLIGTMIPLGHGGRGLDCVFRLASIEEAARISPEFGAFLQIAQLGTMAVLEFGTAAQKARWLPAFAAGKQICTIAITEKESGSYIDGCMTTFRSVPGGVVLNGKKWFIGNAPVASHHVVLARNEADGAFSCYLVEGTAAGADNSIVHETRGLRNFPFGAVVLDEVFIPEENRIGQAGQGKHIAHTIIGRHGRLSLTGLALGIHQRIYDLTASFATERQRYGDSLSSIPDVAGRLFDIFSNLETARSLAYRAATLERDGEPSARLLALAKKLNSELSCKSAQIAMEVHGGRANLVEFEIGQLLLDASMTLAPSGSADLLKKRIIDDILGRRKMGWTVP